MKQDTDFIRVSTSFDKLLLYRFIEKTILPQTEDQYPFGTVYDQEASFYSFRQEELFNPQWYERFNTRVDAGEAIGVTRQHTVLKSTWLRSYPNRISRHLQPRNNKLSARRHRRDT
jgi:hypothetical protein